MRGRGHPGLGRREPKRKKHVWLGWQLSPKEILGSILQRALGKANELLACKQGQEHPELDRKVRERKQTLLPDWKWRTLQETWELNHRQALYGESWLDWPVGRDGRPLCWTREREWTEGRHSQG